MTGPSSPGGSPQKGETGGLVIPEPSPLMDRLCAALEAAQRVHRITIPPGSFLVGAVLDALLAEPVSERMEAMGMVEAPGHWVETPRSVHARCWREPIAVMPGGGRA